MTTALVAREFAPVPDSRRHGLRRSFARARTARMARIKSGDGHGTFPPSSLTDAPVAFPHCRFRLPPWGP